MKYPLIFLWSSPALTMDNAGTTKSPAPIPSMSRAARAGTSAVVTERRKPLAIVRKNPARIIRIRPNRSERIPDGSVLMTAPRKYAE